MARPKKRRRVLVPPAGSDAITCPACRKARGLAGLA